MRKKILLLGSGELGKEVVIAMQRLGQYVIAVDSYKNAPAMQVAHEYEVINMLVEMPCVIENNNIFHGFDDTLGSIIQAHISNKLINCLIIK